jgi:hypothetical protein
MDILLYLFLGVVLFAVGSVIIMFRSINKVVYFFKCNPNGLPSKLPEEVQEFKDHVGEEQFQELYDKFQKENNE